MSSSAENRLVCEQCGTALREAEAHCLHCMLVGGLTADENAPPRDPATAAETATLSGSRFYQHYEIDTRADGSLHELGAARWASPTRRWT
jgi:hypothetical protein